MIRKKYKYGFNTDIFLGQFAGKLESVYVDKDDYGRKTRIFIDLNFCRTWHEFETRATIATSSYYFGYEGDNLISRKSETLPLAANPLYLLEYLEDIDTWKTWINAAIEDEATYEKAKREAAAKLKEQKIHTDKWKSAELLRFRPSTAATTKYCSLEIRKELIGDTQDVDPYIGALLDRWSTREY